MTNTKRVSITAVIPAFNEEKTIGKTVEESKEHVDEVVVVDDGSFDNTGKVASEAGATVIRHPSNLGYGAALATGFSYVRENGANILVVLDADGQHDPADIPRIVGPIVQGAADIVTGSRFMNNDSRSEMPAYRKLGIGVVNKAWNFATKNTLTDTQCGFRAYSRDAIEKMDIKQAGMSASLEILDEAGQKGLRVVEAPISAKYEGNMSSVQPGRHGMELINYVLRKLRNEHPLLIFGTIGVLTSTIGLAFGVYSINSYFESRFLPFGPTIISGILIYVGTLMIFGGLILNSIQSLASRLGTKGAK